MSNWHPDFGPCYTPMEMLDKGIFEGIYTHAIEGIPSKYKSHPNVLGDRGPDVSINEFGVKSRQSLKEWQKKGWTTKLSPLGWWEWYLKYFEGRRDEKEDKLQISRWNSFVARHQAQITQNCDLEDVSCRPRQRQGLLQWGWDSRVAYTDDQVRDNAQRMARLSKAKLVTEAFAPSPDLITLGVSAGSWLLKKGVEKVKDRPKRDRLPKSFNISRSKDPKAYLPYVSVHEEDGYVDVTGFSAGKFSAALTDILNTSRFKNMFHEIYTRNFVIESFFVVEILRCIELLQASGKRTISSSTLESLREKLITNTWIGSVEKAEAKAFKWNNLKRLNIALLPKQRQFLEEYATLVPRLGLKGWLLAAAPGTGKALKNGTKVRMLDGWSNIENLKVGDYVIGQDGKPTKVTGVYPQGKVELYEITFYDGRKAVACKDHLWKINDGRLGKKPHNERWHVVNTQNIYDYFKTSNRFRCYVPLTEPVELKPRRFDVDPYLLGCLLGDGTISNSCIVLHKGDDYIRERFEEATAGEYTTTTIYQDGKVNGFRLVRVDKTRSGALMNPLKEMGLYGSVVRDKFIPAKYYEGSIEQRWELLRGLMDTDGTVDNKTATPSFCSMSLELAKGVQRLVHSLGGIAKITEKKVNYEYVNEPESKVAYIVTIRHREPENLFNLPRKKELCRPSQYSENLKLSIIDIKPVESDEATCISVDNDEKLFLMEGYVVTHNTLTGIAWHLCQDFDTTIYVVPNNTVEDVWEKTLYRFFDKVPSYYISRPNFKLTGKEEFVVCHYEHLPKLLEQLSKFRRRRMGLWVDESHNFNELTSQRTNMLIDMAKEHVEEAVLASGTPLKALGRELVPLFRIIDDLFTPSVEEKFVKTFGSTTGQVLVLLEYRTNRASFKVSKHEVVQNEVREHSIPVRIPNANNYLLSTVRTEIATYITERLGHYEKMNDEIVENYFAYINEYSKQVTDQKAFDLYLSAAREMHRNFSPYVHGAEIKLCSKYEKEYILPWLKDTDRKDFKYWCSRYKYPLLVVRGEALGRVLGRRRIECCIDMVPYTGLEDIVEKATKKTVIFTNHVEVLKEICEHLELMGHSPIAVYGETNKELSDNLKRFMNDPKAKIIVATYKSLSTGVPLVEASSLVLFDSPFRNYIVEQTISRLDRLDQDSAIDIIRPYLETDGRDNLSTRSIELAEWSKELVDSILKLDKIDERFLATEYYSVAHDALLFSEAPETLYHVELVLGDNKPHTVELNPIYPNGSEFAKSRKAKDMWFYDAAVERVAMYETIEGALRANYHSWRDIVEKHGKSGFKVRVYECANPSNHRWVAPKTLVSSAAVHDAHLTRCWWAMEPVQLKPINERHWKEKDNSGKVFEYSNSGELHVEWDDDSPFIWIQLYGNEETREHSPRKVEWWLHDECNEVTDVNALAAYEIECMRHAIEVGNSNIPEFEGYSGGVALTTESYYETHSDRGGDYGDERDKLAMILAHSSKDLYHISFSKLPRTLKPQIPAGSEKTDPTHHTHEPQIPRICFSETIEGAVRAVYPNVKHLVKQHAGEELTWHVHKVKKGTSGSWVPSWALEEAKFVPDANLTKEWWALSDVTIEYIGTVDVKMDANGEHLKYNPYGVRGRYDHSPLDIIFNTDNVTGVFDLV